VGTEGSRPISRRERRGECAERCAVGQTHVAGGEKYGVRPMRLEPPPDSLRLFPPPSQRGQCPHLGDEIGLRDCPSCLGNVRLKMFANNHPAHVETMLQECHVFTDHEEKERDTGGRGAASKSSVGKTTHDQ